MAGRRELRLPRMRSRSFAVVCAVVLALCGALAAAFRASLTDYNAHPDALAALPVSLGGRAVEPLLSKDEFETALREMADDGVEMNELDYLGLVSRVPADVAERAPVVVIGTFTGARRYVYQAFKCEVELTEVIRGEGLAASDVISVYERAQITDGAESSLTGMGMFGPDRELWWGDGRPPLREGQEYLFLLRPKVASSDVEDSTYCAVSSLYGWIATDAPEHPERVRVSQVTERVEVLPDGSTATFYDVDALPFSELAQYDFLAVDEASKAQYLANCEALLATALSVQTS